MRLRGMAAWMILCMALVFTGCTQGNKNENIDLGMEAVSQLDYKGALEYFEKAMVNQEDAELLYRGQGIAYIGLTQYEDAVGALEKSLSYCDGNVSGLQYDTNYYLATAYYKSGDIDAALGVYDAILDLRDKEKNAYYLRGTLELEKDNYDAAAADFDKAIALDPAAYSCLIDIYKSLEKNGYEQAGQEYLRAALEKENGDMSDYDKGRLYYYLKDYEDARNCLERARDTGGAEAVLYLGRTYEALGDYNYAASVYATYLEQHQDRPEIYNQLGLCKMQMKDYEAALTAFQTGLTVENNDFLQTLKFNEIAAYEFLGQYKKATVLMEGYLELYPDDAQAAREYEFLKTR